ncbi:hypothetical protein AB0K12_17825 [Nonomuraea sp. NPDC049419]|uniref:hypothetical protein n=1 Tax=unclassified Nonomuraea TaxID=2593643 RepID=UPI00343A07E0
MRIARLVGAAVIGASGILLSATPSNAADIAACRNAPGDANCTGAQIKRHDACWENSRVVAARAYSELGWNFLTTLRWSQQCQSNFAVTELTSLDILHSPYYELRNKVRRHAGPNGPYRMLYAPWARLTGDVGSLVISPLVWSPTNPAEACLSIRSNDQVVCTEAI